MCGCAPIRPIQAPNGVWHSLNGKKGNETCSLSPHACLACFRAQPPLRTYEMHASCISASGGENEAAWPTGGSGRRKSLQQQGAPSGVCACVCRGPQKRPQHMQAEIKACRGCCCYTSYWCTGSLAELQAAAGGAVLASCLGVGRQVGRERQRAVRPSNTWPRRGRTALQGPGGRGHPSRSPRGKPPPLPRGHQGKATLMLLTVWLYSVFGQAANAQRSHAQRPPTRRPRARLGLRRIWQHSASGPRSSCARSSCSCVYGYGYKARQRSTAPLGGAPHLCHGPQRPRPPGPGPGPVAHNKTT